jgi:hypothetical protein
MGLRKTIQDTAMKFEEVSAEFAEGKLTSKETQNLASG